MVVLPRRRAPRGTNSNPRNNPYGSPPPNALPHGYYPPPYYQGHGRWLNPQTILVLLMGMGIGYLVLPAIVSEQNSHIGFEGVVKRVEAGRMASVVGGAGNVGSGGDAGAGPMNMMRNRRETQEALLRRGDAASINRSRRTSADVGSPKEVGNVLGKYEHKLEREPESAADAAVAQHVGGESRAVPVVENDSVEAVEVEDTAKFNGKVPSKINPNHHPFNVEDESLGIDIPEVQKRFVEDQKLLASQSIPTATNPHVFQTPSLPDSRRKKILITGGAGFVGSHLVDKLMQEGHEVIVVDNFFTGQRKNVDHWMHHPRFSLVVHDVTEPIMLEVDEIYHLACPASPPHYQYNPVKTIKTSTMGTINMLGLAKRVKAKILLTSTSEIYGDPKVHPQPESYWGNVNTIGPRSCYDEGKRVAETMMYSYRNQNNVDVRVARIFNTFGPRMHPNDGRVVSNFIIQCLQDKPITIYGDGSQTRSFQYVSDLVDGLHALMNGNYDLPVNLGNPDEYTVKEFAQHIKDMTKSESNIDFFPKPQDDPTQRKPDISTAKREIGWEPKVTVKEGLKKTITYFSRVLDESGEIIPTGQKATRPKPKLD